MPTVDDTGARQGRAVRIMYKLNKHHLLSGQSQLRLGWDALCRRLEAAARKLQALPPMSNDANEAMAAHKRWWIHGWMCLAGCVLLLIAQGLCLGRSPFAITELQFAGNDITAQAVRAAWKISDRPFPNCRLIGAFLFDTVFIVFYLPLLARSVFLAGGYYVEGARRWRSAFFLAVLGIALTDLLENIFAILYLSGASSTLGIETLRFVFHFATVKAFLLGASLLYVAFGIAQAAWIRGAWEAVRVCGFSVFAALVGPGLLKFGEQADAIFGATAERLANRDYGPYWYAVFAALAFSLMCWGAARYAVSYKADKPKEGRASVRQQSKEEMLTRRSVQMPTGTPNAADEDFDAGWDWAKRWVPRVCGVAPGLLLAWITATSKAQDKRVGWAMLGVAGLVSFWLWCRSLYTSSKRLADHKQQQRRETMASFDAISYWLFSIVFGALAIVGCATPAILQRFRGGPLAAWFLSFALMVPFFTWLVWSGRRSRKPFLALFLAYGFLCNAANLNDDHGLRHRYYQDSRAWKETTTLNKAFDDWLTKKRAAAKWPDGEPYPVVFVAAAGGGIVAGSLVTATMAQMHQSVPTIGSHLFAISSVSGGSLGAVTYVAERKVFTERERRSKADPSFDAAEAEAAKQVFTTDMLSPSVASLLAPELVQRFLPFAVPNYFREGGYANEFAMDRGRALDLAFEKALKESENGEAVLKNAQTFMTDFSPPAESDLPALFLNTTCVETGERMVISTLRPDDPKPGQPPLPFETLYDVDPRVDVPLTTAACLSARFPVVSPPAFLQQWRKTPVSGGSDDNPVSLTVKRRYVDGGYCENSGVQTAMDIIAALRSQDARRQREADRKKRLWIPIIVSIHMGRENTGKQTARNDAFPQSPGAVPTRAGMPRRAGGFDELLGPANAFTKGWGGPPRPEMMRARLYLGSTVRKTADSVGAKSGATESEVPTFIELNFPDPVLLSWYMSRHQYKYVEAAAQRQLGEKGDTLVTISNGALSSKSLPTLEESGQEGEFLRRLLSHPPSSR